MAVTAFQPPEISENLTRIYGIHSFASATITDEIALGEEFAKVRRQGYAEDLEESVTGGRRFAAPVLRSNGVAIGAVSLSLPLMRYRATDSGKKSSQRS
jgi:DNA-binding IclR family transcriptional regulator